MFKLLSATQINEADAFTIKNTPISSIDLMEHAADKCVELILKLYPETTIFHIFCGTGNN